MSVLDSQRSLKRMIRGGASGLQNVNGAEIVIWDYALAIRFVGIRQTNQPSPFAADIAKFDGSILSESLLYIQIPVLGIRAGKFSRSCKNGVRPVGVHGQDRNRRIEVGAVERACVE